MNRVFGKYHLRRRIAVGGMAELFLASVEGVEGFARQLVIKCMLPELARDPEFVKMFVDEAKLAAKLFHPDIVQVYELGVVSRRYFIAMEYVHGLDLAALSTSMKTAGIAIPPGAVVNIGAAALRALHYAHEKKDDTGISFELVHRDVSPQNILISTEGVVKLTDFGIAKARNRSTKTGTGTLKGKFAYMAPEYASGGRIDRRSDLFSIAMVLYELFAGEHPYHPRSDVDSLEQARAADIPDLTQVKPDFPATLSGVMQKALAKDPADRFATAELFVNALFESRSAFPLFSASELGALVSRLRVAETADEEDDALLELGDGGSRTPRPGHATGVIRPETPAPSPPRGSEKSRLSLAALVASACVLLAGLLWFGLRTPERAAPQPLVAISPPLPLTGPATNPASAVIPGGYLTLNSSPWSQVWVDGKKLPRSTPLHNLQLPVGRHLVKLYSPGAGQEQELSVDITAGHTTTKIVNFEKRH